MPLLRSRLPSLALIAAALLATLLAALPLLYVILRAFEARPGQWARLWTTSLPGLLLNTGLLVFVTTALAIVIGVGSAWLVERCDLPGRSIWRVVLAIPLAVPAYIAAICWVMLLRRGGMLEQWLMANFGLERGQTYIPGPYGWLSAAAIIALCVYPYIYLPVAAVLRSADRALDEVAQMCGCSPQARFRRVTLPLIMPAISGGALLVALYALSDFGTVSILRYRTFTTAIYNQLAAQIDRSGAAILSAVLVMLILPLILVDARLGQQSMRRRSGWRPRRPRRLGRWRWVALLAISMLVTLALGIPVGVLLALCLEGWLHPTQVDQIWQLNNVGIVQFGLNSLLIAAAGASLAAVIALAPAYLSRRFPGRATSMLQSVIKGAAAMPGIIVGLALVLILNRWFPLIYGSIAALMIGMSIRLLPGSATLQEAALHSVSPTMEHAGRMLGLRAPQVVRRITLPLAAPGLMASWLLGFMSAMKELPVAILLRPAGFDTLPIRIWSATSESVYTQAALPALLLIGITITTLLLVMRLRTGLDRHRA